MTADNSVPGAPNVIGNENTGAVGAKRFVIMVLIVFTIGAGLNIASQMQAEPRERAIVVRDDNSIHNIVGTELDMVRGRFWVASTVHDVAYGGTIVVPDADLIRSWVFRDLAGADVVVEEYVPELTDEMISELDDLPNVTGIGNLMGNGDVMPFGVVWVTGGTPVPVLRYWTDGETFYLVDERVFGNGSS